MPLREPTGNHPGASELRTTTPAQLRRLLQANRLAVEHLDLPRTLRQIVEAAVDLVGAPYAAIGVLGTDGLLEQFVHTGMDEATVAAIGALPVGRGLLALSPEDPRPVRLASMNADPRSVGVPPGHPELASFLGVPLQVRDEVYGHLYLADTVPGAFSEDDQVLVEALATTAGIAIDHARLFGESQRRERWTAVTTEITQELLSETEVDALQLVADRVRELAGADLVAVVLTNGADEPFTDVGADRVSGRSGAQVLGKQIAPGDGLVRRCLRSRRPQLVDELVDELLDEGGEPAPRYLPVAECGPAMALPLTSQVGMRGSILVLRDRGQPRFTELDLDVAASLADHAALALDRADARLVRVRLEQVDDRDRIARDLHDHVVQRLFAAGLGIQSVRSALPPGPLPDRLGAQVDEIDATIRQVRTTIFGLHDTAAPTDGLRTRVLAVVAGVGMLLAEPPAVTFRGPLDLLVDPPMHEDVEAVVREGLSNAARHARARQVAVSVEADPSTLVVTVADDGVGLGEGSRRSGLDNLRVRAVRLGGTLTATTPPGGGTLLTWTVPLGDAPPG
ncbi:sensor histidine kinase [Nocardioides sp. AX2bis]|uniref:sensor histidine kinase n=1 Tax=Nocardioides sp. AX2bis TaxID=2653157 RepID=UPI0012F0F9B4|nr:GAF domain-containing protein [Nocardioides sp. AX2bis]VXC46210.1 Oxygen sensor histidine kinase response regulator DevS/DosS [Nocardioides sp. AX2bis]